MHSNPLLSIYRGNLTVCVGFSGLCLLAHTRFPGLSLYPLFVYNLFVFDSCLLPLLEVFLLPFLAVPFSAMDAFNISVIRFPGFESSLVFLCFSVHFLPMLIEFISCLFHFASYFLPRFHSSALTTIRVSLISDAFFWQDFSRVSFVALSASYFVVHIL